MNENLDLTKILEGCPVGTKFYHTIYGTVYFYSINRKFFSYPILFSLREEDLYLKSVTKEGRTYIHGKCTLFPSKDQRDWSKFVRFWDKPKVEKFDPKTFHPFDKVLVRTNHKGFWSCDLYSHINYEYMANVVCVGDVWEMCIPYNDDTKHLLGTTDDCPEYYKWWEE